ncbi:MAG: hypothetical protein JXQ73_13920 [Phycisphaerae bacterium]|nr:hypothetical protein [Phycisphaerae bacterium]
MMSVRTAGYLAGVVSFGLLCGCQPTMPSLPNPIDPTDPTNGNARYIGSAACRACHPEVAALHDLHGHANALSRIQGAEPVFPEAAARAAVPDPPVGKAWTDISYVIGGYTHSALFVDQAGYVLTNGTEGVDTQWNLEFLDNGTAPGFAPYKVGQTTPLPYDYDCFRCHTTGAKRQDANRPEFQDNRPGMAGTWEEMGVQCEACHGPGSNHVPSPEAGGIYINTRASWCGRCHISGDDPNVIAVEDGYVSAFSQWPQLLASGGHADFDCTYCHNTHASVFYDGANSLRNECTDCHTDQSMALHEGKIFVQGDYVERMKCQSCHMPLIARSGSAASRAVVGDEARVGDVRGHIIRINVENQDYTTMFSGDGSRVLKDDQGRSAVTIDFVCLRCHNGNSNAFQLTLRGASSVAGDIHVDPNDP